MCGICGYINWDNTEALNRMLARMTHRGPDEEGKHIEHGLALGIRRLSIIDPEGGRQPAANETKTIWVVLNGEIYNYRELRDELIRKGHQFATRSDTEVIVHLYEEQGEAMVHRLRGMFAICLWDSDRRVFLLIRDRLGIKPLYYTERNGAVIFASELRALREAVPNVSIRHQAIIQYLSLLYIPAPDTIFEGIKHLLPGEMLKVQGSHKTIHKYFDIQTYVTGRLEKPAGDCEAHFRELLKDTVRAHLVSDVPLGLFLSGGLDSGSILAMMRAVTDGPIRTFSIGYEAEADKEFNETDAARLLAKRYGAEHTEELLRPDAAALLPKIVEAMGEPFADSSAIPTYLVSEVAKSSVKVALAGIGGDELFGGYPRYLGIQAGAHYRKLPTPLRRMMASLVAPLFPERGGHRDQMARLKRFLQTGLLPMDQQYLHWLTFLPAEWGKNAFSPDLRSPEVDQLIAIQAYRTIFNDWPSDAPADKAMGLDLQTYLPDDLLRMGDRLSMAHSLELRVPFCDHELLAFALQIPAGVRMRGWHLKSFMRHALRPVLPKEILERPKLGFMVPLARWLREDLQEMVADLLSEQSVKRRGYLEPAYVQWLISEHTSLRHNFSDQIFALLVLELWLRGMGDGKREA